MAVTPIETVSDLLEQFDLVELRSLIAEQTAMNDTMSPNVNIPDYFKPIYFNWKRIMDNASVSDEFKEEATVRFEEFCKIILKAIRDRFELQYDEDWIFGNTDSFPGITLCLYVFFILDLRANLISVFDNYIFKHTPELYEHFEAMRTKKDASTMANKKGHDLQTAVLISNMYDVGARILEILQENSEDYFEYLDPDYYPKDMVQKLFHEDHVSGNFVKVIKDIYDTQISFKSYVCFEVISNIKSR